MNCFILPIFGIKYFLYYNTFYYHILHIRVIFHYSETSSDWKIFLRQFLIRWREFSWILTPENQVKNVYASHLFQHTILSYWFICVSSATINLQHIGEQAEAMFGVGYVIVILCIILYRSLWIYIRWFVTFSHIHQCYHDICSRRMKSWDWYCLCTVKGTVSLRWMMKVVVCSYGYWSISSCMTTLLWFLEPYSCSSDTSVRDRKCYTPSNRYTHTQT